MNNVVIRLEQPSDYRTVEELTRDAFWDVYKPGCDEHLVAHRLRTHPDFIPELDFVALGGDEIVGNIMYSRAAIVQLDGTRFPIVISGRCPCGRTVSAGGSAPRLCVIRWKKPRRWALRAWR